MGLDTADQLMALDNGIVAHHGWTSATEAHKVWDEYLHEIDSKMDHFGIPKRKIGKRAEEYLENENYHTFLEALADLGYANKKYKSEHNLSMNDTKDDETDIHLHLTEYDIDRFGAWLSEIKEDDINDKSLYKILKKINHQIFKE